MTKTKVVHVNSPEWAQAVKDSTAVYIGRFTFNGKKPPMAKSKWHNPFVVGRHGTIDEVLAQYRTHVENTPELFNALLELYGKTLGCWCKARNASETGRPCHGDVLRELADRAMAEYAHHALTGE